MFPPALTVNEQQNVSGLKKWMVEVKGYKVGEDGVVMFKTGKNGESLFCQMMRDIDEFRALERAFKKERISKIKEAL